MPDKNTALIPQFQQKQHKKLSKEETYFNERVHQIKELKEYIQKAKDITDEFDRLNQTELMPIFHKITKQKIKFIQILDKNYSSDFFRKKEKEKIACLILDEIDQLPDLAPDLESIKQKYADLGYLTNTAKPPNTEDTPTQTANDDAHDDFLFDDFFDALSQEKNDHHTRKINKSSEKQVKKSENEKQLNKTIRTLYTELIKVLHPDRESDEEIKLAKTEIMKNVTEAYKKRDYFGLMQLQIAYLQGLGGKNLQETPKETLQQYNKILLNQKKALETEWNRLSSPRSALGTLIGEAVKNKSYLYYKINMEKSQMKKHIQQLKHNNLLFEQDKRYITQYLESIDLDDFED